MQCINPIPCSSLRCIPLAACAPFPGHQAIGGTISNGLKSKGLKSKSLKPKSLKPKSLKSKGLKTKSLKTKSQMKTWL
jgi:hypothetical protein